MSLCVYEFREATWQIALGITIRSISEVDLDTVSFDDKVDKLPPAKCSVLEMISIINIGTQQIDKQLGKRRGDLKSLEGGKATI